MGSHLMVQDLFFASASLERERARLDVLSSSWFHKKEKPAHSSKAQIQQELG